ncbi:MAG: alpha-L-arabinofuranosidase C-terminal domain-containing protein, partial [Caldicoprobacteraceae bacterium]
GLGMYCATDKDHTWKSASYYTMTSFVKYAKGLSIMPKVECDTYDVKSYAIDDMNQYRGFKGVPYITAAAALNEKDGEFTVFVSNGDWEDEHEFTLDVRSFYGYKFVEHTTMYSDDLEAANSFENPDVIKPVVAKDTVCKDGIVTANLNKLSWNVFRFKK